MVLLVCLLWKFSTNELNLSVYDFKNFQDELEGEVDLGDNGTELPPVGNLQKSSLISCHCHIWATSWQNQRNDSATSEDSDQPGHPSSLIRVFAVHMKKAWVLSYPLSAQRRLIIRLGGCPGWSEPSLGTHSCCWFCHVSAHISDFWNGTSNMLQDIIGCLNLISYGTLMTLFFCDCSGTDAEGIWG